MYVGDYRRFLYRTVICSVVGEGDVVLNRVGEEKVILFNLSGHGLIDMASYDKYLAGDLVNYSLTDEDIQKNLDEIGNLEK